LKTEGGKKREQLVLGLQKCMEMNNGELSPNGQVDAMEEK
jgi:hypothetical protein